MKTTFALALMVMSFNMANAQKVYNLPVSTLPQNDTEKVTTYFGQKNITGVVNPSIEVYLPEASKANGCAVILCPGGGMRALSWGSDVEQMAKWLNERGIAAIGLKYRLNNAPMPQGMKMPQTVDVTRIDYFKQADANPLHYAEGDSALMKAALDGRNAILFTRQHAEEWNINPQKVGFLGFSAGGGVALAAYMTAQSDKEQPNFIATNFGPSLMPVNPKEALPPLLIMSRVDHQNVAAGLVDLFLEWKKAGGNAELHMFADGTGPYALMPHNETTTTESWDTIFYQWLKAKKMVE